MNNPTASKQYVLPLQFTSADITDGILVDGAFTFYYKKLGNFYFAFNYNQSKLIGATLNPSYPPALAQIHDTFDRFASLLGVTITDYYPANSTDAPFTLVADNNFPPFYFWDGTTYVQATANFQLYGIGFLVN